METPEIQKLTLELGDIIKIVSSSNSDVNDKIFYINYIDKDKCKLINIKNKQEIVLNITENEFDDKSIEGIKILNRATEVGYARQNNLLTGKWITIMLGGEIPLTINGQITDLEEDMIEISLWPDNEKIYIDFAYKGLPENLNITSITSFKDPRKKEEQLDDIEEGKDQVYWIQDFHQNGRGWNDIGYHFLVDRVGNIYQGRPETVIGAHVGGANTGNIGVCLLGCYHPPEVSCLQEITTESREAVVKLFSWISDTYGQSPSLLLGHRDYFGSTACPGDNVWIDLPRFRAEIFDFTQSYFEIPPISIFKSPYPNPFFNSISFNFDLIDQMDFKMNIYDLLGRKVNMIERNNASSGRLTLLWDGKDFSGKKLGSGIYIAKPISSNDIDPLKVILLKK